MDFALGMLNSSSPVACMIVGLVLLASSALVRKLGSRTASLMANAHENANAHEEEVRVRLQDRKLVSIERRAPARVTVLQPMRRLATASPVPA